MSYQVLARKWRPHNFQEVVGQQHVLTALSNGLAQNKVHHAYLFSGTRGVGKTTIARILAKSLNCEQGVTATPCGQCVHCQAIDQGRFVDLLEIDAASRTKVDDTRELLDNVQYKPAQGRYKVYLIDEVHMLSKHSFNALLKTLEEPPEYVKFLLATTDPQKLPITVLSRCLQFHLKALLPEEIEKQLNFILQQEKATYEHAALTVIAKAADGSMRDALSLTDQALAFGAGNIEYQSVLKMLGTIDHSHLLYLLHFIASGNVEKVFQKIAEFVHLGADFAKLHQELASLCHQIALLQMQGKKHLAEKSGLQLLAERLSPEEVQLYYQISVQGYKDYEFAPNGKIALEMTVMRLLAFKPANYITLDESQLTQSPIDNALDNDVASKQQIIETLPMPATDAVETNIKPVHLVASAVVEAPIGEPNKQQIPDVHQQSANAAPPFIAKTEAIVAVPTIEDPVAESPEVAEPIEQSSEVEESIEQVTRSRNMLRSHRLKRDEAKKSQATTNNQIIDDVVASETTLSSQPIIEKPERELDHSQELITNMPHPSVDNVPDQQTDMLNQSAMPEHALPPIDSYLYDQDSETEQEPHIDHYSAIETVEAIDTTSNIMATDATHTPPTSSFNAELAEQPQVHETVLFSSQELEVPAIDIAKYVEDKITDPWSLAIQQMELVGLVKLLAKNSVMKQLNQQVTLTLKAEQQHLLNNAQLCEQLQASIKSHYGSDVNMYIEVGEVEGSLTPNESELQLYQQYLDNAKRAIKEDSLVQILQRDYAAKIYENTIIPL